MNRTVGSDRDPGDSGSYVSAGAGACEAVDSPARLRQPRNLTAEKRRTVAIDALPVGRVHANAIGSLRADWKTAKRREQGSSPGWFGLKSPARQSPGGRSSFPSHSHPGSLVCSTCRQLQERISLPERSRRSQQGRIGFQNERHHEYCELTVFCLPIGGQAASTFMWFRRLSESPSVSLAFLLRHCVSRVTRAGRGHTPLSPPTFSALTQIK